MRIRSSKRLVSKQRSFVTAALLLILISSSVAAQDTAPESKPDETRKPIPDKLVVLTFDDSVRSHYTIVRPILKKYGFNATFYFTEGFDFKTNKTHYMTWEQIAELHKEGFEIGNHTRDHTQVREDTLDKLSEQITSINKQCLKHGLPATTTFAYPANQVTPKALPLLKKLGVTFARRGNQPEYPTTNYEHGKGFAYQPGIDHPLLIPSTGIAMPDWTLDDLVEAVEKAHDGQIAVLQFHGVPDIGHPWVNTPIEKFEIYMRYLHDYKYKVIALRDLEQYVDPEVAPREPFSVIKARQQAMKEDNE